MRGLLLPIVTVLVLSAAGPTGRQSEGRVQDTVAVHLFQFKPGLLEITPGTTVTWSNGDQIEHNVTAGVPDSLAGDFRGTLATKGSTWSRTFDRPGSYRYYCSRHSSMRGEIRVTTSKGN